MPKLDKCMFCNCSPCECNTKKKAPLRPRVKKEPEVEVLQSRPSSALEAMRRASLRPVPAAPTRPQIVARQPDEQAELISAIKVVRSLLGGRFLDPDDETIFKAALRETDSPQLRAHLWRSRREAGRVNNEGL